MARRRSHDGDGDAPRLEFPLPVAVVGCGNMGQHHARNYAELPETHLVAVVDADLARASAAADRFGCQAFSRLEDFLAQCPGVAGVSVAVPTSMHYEVARALLTAGKHVLVEKPFAETVEQATALIRHAHSESATLAVGHVERFNPVVRELKERIDAGLLGRIVSVSARRLGMSPPQIHDANVILDLAIHDIDIFRYILSQDRPTTVYCSAGKAVRTDRLDFADIFLQFNGVACLLQANWITPVKIRSLAVSGTRAYVEVDYVTQSMKFYPAQRGEKVDSFRKLESYSRRPPIQIRVEWAEPLAVQLREFSRQIVEGTGEMVTGAEARVSLEIVSEILRTFELRRAEPEIVTAMGSDG